jgi:hypothetical protein
MKLHLLLSFPFLLLFIHTHTPQRGGEEGEGHWGGGERGERPCMMAGWLAVKNERREYVKIFP